MNHQLVKGIVFVSLGACCYGILATFAKLGFKNGYSTSELTFAQYFVGFLGLLFLNLINSFKKNNSTTLKPTFKDKLKLMAGGFSMGLTSICYYLSLNYVSVSVCLVLLMQSVWMGALLDLIINKKKPTKNTIFTIILILFGTALATNIFNQEISINIQGIIWGLLSGLFYTFSLFSSNKIATQYSSLTRSVYLILGAVLIIVILWHRDLLAVFHPKLLFTWGILLALLGTIIPPLFFTRGMPIIGVGLGTIIASLELPVSVLVAAVVLQETVSFTESTGIFLIVLAVVLMNYSLLRKPKRSIAN